MVAPTRIGHRWDTRGYADIAAVRYEPGRLLVSFLDGSLVSLTVDDLRAYGVEDHEWQHARSEVHHIAVPTKHGEVEIPWDVVRALTDGHFRDYLSEHALRTVKYVGARFRDLRQNRGLDASEVARRAGVTTGDIDRLESGELPADLDLENRVLASLGLTRDQAFPVASLAPS